MTWRARLARAGALAACIALSIAGDAAAAVPESWRETGFAIDTTNLTLDKVLAEFGAAYGVRVVGSVRGGRPLGGRIKAGSGTDFLDRLASTQQFRWFVFANTLYVAAADDQVSARLRIGEDAVLDAKAALAGMGLYDVRFGWGELPDEGIVMVSGPRAYVDLVKQFLTTPAQEEPAPARGRQIMVFRLKYASVQDRVIATRSEKQTIPGIKSLLTGLLAGDGGNAGAGDSLGEDFSVASKKPSGRPKHGRDAKGDMAAAPEKRVRPAPARERPRIDADVARNALIVYDDVDKRDMYASLIAELDVAPRQIEIEALIVDIDRNSLSDLGVEWGVRAGTTSAGVRVGGGGDDQHLPGATLTISNAARFYARMKLLEGRGLARVLARPTVVTLENVAALLDMSQTAYVPLVGERVADLADISVGTMLHVTPRVVQEAGAARVQLEVDIEDGTLDGKGSDTRVSKSTISTQAIVDLQQTLMIGGYHAETSSRQTRKVPGLGDLPVLGGLFRSETKEDSTRERLFLITPRVIGGDTAAAASGAAGQAQRAAAAAAAAAAPARKPPAMSLPMPARLPAGVPASPPSRAAPSTPLPPLPPPAPLATGPLAPPTSWTPPFETKPVRSARRVRRAPKAAEPGPP